MNWYLRKSDQTVYGPVALDVLARWAADGRVLPDDHVSTDQQDWKPAPDLPELGMDWFIELAGDTRYGPLHLLAMAELVREQAANGGERLIHRSNGEEWRLADALMRALIDHATALQDALDTRVPQLLMVPGPSHEEIAQREAELELRIREAQARADDAARELAEAVTREREAEARAGETARQLAASAARVSELEAARPADASAEWRTRCEKAEALLRQREDQLKAATQARGVAGQEKLDQGALLKSYNDLSRNYENLLERLRAKQDEVDAAKAEIVRLEQDAEDRTNHLEVETEQERAEIEQLKQKLAETEKNHQELVRAYRDLNDRYIRLRQQSDAPAPAPATPAHDVPAAPPRGKSPEKPRVRLV